MCKLQHHEVLFLIQNVSNGVWRNHWPLLMSTHNTSPGRPDTATSTAPWQLLAATCQDDANTFPRTEGFDSRCRGCFWRCRWRCKEA